jgi:hypothetical protein
MGASAVVTSEAAAAELISAPAAGATDLVDAPAPPPADFPTPAPEPPAPEVPVPEVPAPEAPVDTGLLDGLLATVSDTVAGLLSTLLGLLGGAAPV